MENFFVDPGVIVFSGPMFSGKTERLQYHMGRFRAAGVKTQVFRPERDDRKERSIADAIKVNDLNELFAWVTAHNDVQVIGIDEFQFFMDERIGEMCQQLAMTHGKRVYVSGLDLDFRGKPFPGVPGLLAIATCGSKKLSAICTDPSGCGKEASRSQRTVAGSEMVLVGGGESYAPRCLRHFKPTE